MMRNLNQRHRLIGLLLVAMLGAALIGCGSGEPPAAATSPAAERSATAPALLPTPTLAAPGSVDPLRPPTPQVMSSPTPASDMPTAEPVATGEATTLDPASGEATETQPTATPALPPDATPEELFALGRRAAAEGDHATAAAAFRAVTEAPGTLSESDVAEARLGLALALVAEGEHDTAALELETILQTPLERDTAGGRTGNDTADRAAFHLAQARAAAGDWTGAVEAYRAYLQNNADMAAYVQPLIADAYEALGDTAAARAALEGALDAPAQRFQAVGNHSRLAASYLAAGEYDAAIAQYDAIHDIARTEATKGQMTYLAGQAELMAGNTTAAQERFRFAVENYPRAAESHAALVALLDAGAEVDEYWRGVVDYYAAAYAPGVEALRRYVAAAPDEGFRPDAYLFLAWSLEALGDAAGGLAALDEFAAHEPARALFERGELLARAGRNEEALAAYDQFLTDFPEAEGAAGVAWAAAALADGAGLAGAGARYLALADAFPFDGNAPAALARATELAADAEEATALRQRLAEQYPANVHGAEALFRLLLAGQEGASEQVATLTPSNYFALRAADFVAGIDPFTAEGAMNLPDDPDAGRAEAETWLRQLPALAGTTPPSELGVLSTELAADARRVIGEKLWRLGLLEEAKVELEVVREAYAADPLANYQLALYFRDLGLYRSSIVAASSLLGQAGATVFDAPRFLGRLAYPTHYADLILPLAGRYGFDPRLQFALVRQESLFESFARSGAAAQGLSQVIPDTGAWIAQRLAWPEFVNEDLYKPYVGLNFGAYYLSEQLRNFDGLVHAALAAYNGGPGNAARWLEEAGADHDRFVDTVDFPETRLYIERIYEGFNAYRHLYGQP